MLSKPNREEQAAQSPRPGVYLEHEGERAMQRVLATVDNVPWSVTLIQLAWTAGPVTYIAAQGGYYLGFKQFLPFDRIAFFIGYTIIAGVIGMLTTVIYDGYRRRKRQRHEYALTTAVDRLPELIFAIRNLALEALPPEQRRQEAAWRVLKESAPGPAALATVVEDLTGNAHFADTVRRIDIYRRAGMHSRARDLLEEEAPLIGQVVDDLQGALPAVAATLRDLLEGRGPTAKRGVPRDENFIERTLAAIGEENLALMTLYDAEEILVLAFELLNGRKIPLLVFNYRGHWHLARAADALEKARTDYRISQALVYSRLKALVAYLTERDTELAESPGGQQSGVLLEKVQRSLDQLRDAIYQLRVEVAGGRMSLLDELHDRTETLATAVRLYRAMQEAYREQGRRHATLIRARQRWDELAGRSSDTATALRTGRGRRGLRIAERSLRLDDAEKMALAEALARPLRSLDLRRRPRRDAHGVHGMRPLTVEAAKDVAVEVALVLEESIHISRPENQRALDAANAALLADIEPGMSTATKAALGAAAATAVQTDIAGAAERLASALVRHYHIDLGEEAIAFLHRTYGANLETLQVLANYSEPAPAVPVSQLRSRPPAIPPLDENWVRQLRRARRLLERNERPVAR